MAAALAKGLVNAGLAAPENMIASDPIAAGREAFGQALGCETTDSNSEVLANAEVISWRSSRTNSMRPPNRCVTNSPTDTLSFQSSPACA